MRAATIAVSVARSATEASKPDYMSTVSRREERNAKEMISKAWVMPNPPVLRRRDERRTWRDLKNWVAPKISSRTNSVRALSKVSKGARTSTTGGVERRR